MVLVITAIFQAGVRRYPLIFIYTVVSFLFAALQVPNSLQFRYDRSLGEWLQKVNSISQGTTYALILVVVLSLIYSASGRVASRRLVLIALIGGALLVAAISFLVHYDRRVLIGVWMTSWGRDLRFAAAILDLTLWGLLVSARKKDGRLLLLTGGMGIMFAGEAIGAAIRALAIPRKSITLFYGGHLFDVLADAAFLYVWWQVFRKEAAMARKRDLTS
jgi:hypothetical protein